LYYSPTFIRATKARRMRWAGKVARMGKREMHTKFWSGNFKGREQFGNIQVDERVILRLGF